VLGEAQREDEREGGAEDCRHQDSHPLARLDPNSAAAVSDRDRDGQAAALFRGRGPVVVGAALGDGARALVETLDHPDHALPIVRTDLALDRAVQDHPTVQESAAGRRRGRQPLGRQLDVGRIEAEFGADLLKLLQADPGCGPGLARRGPLQNLADFFFVEQPA